MTWFGSQKSVFRRHSDMRVLLGDGFSQLGQLLANEVLSIHFLCWDYSSFFEMSCLEYAVYQLDGAMAVLLFLYGADPLQNTFEVAMDHNPVKLFSCGRLFFFLDYPYLVEQPARKITLPPTLATCTSRAVRTDRQVPSRRGPTHASLMGPLPGFEGCKPS